MTAQETPEPLIVSMTSYPARINSVAHALETIYHQTLAPDKVVLYLAAPQFPSLERELPATLIQFHEERGLDIRWVDQDLGPHKKYFYAFRDFPDSLIVTVDDDLRYPNDLLKMLLRGHHYYPEAVIASRTHFITYTSNGTMKPYREWILEFSGLVQVPSMRLLATGGAGTLYPTRLFKARDYDPSTILAHAPIADDLWLKAMEVQRSIPVVLCKPCDPLQYIADTQEVGLFHRNLDNNENDSQWMQISERFLSTHNCDLAETIRIWDDTHAPLTEEILIEYFRDELSRANERVEDREHEIDRIHASRTWQAGRVISFPLRAIRQLLGK